MKFNPLKIQKEVNANCDYDELQIEKTDSKEEVLEKLKHHQDWLIDHAYEQVNSIYVIIKKYQLEEEEV